MRRHEARANGGFLVIGYGNVLRSDDGAGLRVAEAIGRWARPDVHSLAVHQLTPELAVRLAVAEFAVFVDARVAAEGDDVITAAIEPDASMGIRGHHGDPRSLLALARWLHGRSPCSWLLTIPGVEFSIGEDLSPTAARGIAVAVDRIARIVYGRAGRLRAHPAPLTSARCVP